MIRVLVFILVTAAPASAADDVLAWNVHTLNVLAQAGQTTTIVATRSVAMVHAAIHDALNTIDPRYKPYGKIREIAGSPGASPEAAIAAAAHHVLIASIPGFGTPAQQKAGIAAANATYAASLALIPDGVAKTNSIAIGRAAAARIVTLRANDGARLANIPYTPSPQTGAWQPTPHPVPPSPLAGPGLLPASLPGWAKVTPFVLERQKQFRPRGPWPLGSRKYAAEYDETRIIGEKLSAVRTADQSTAARFWYEPSLTGWNRIARVVAAPRALDLWQQARLFALINLAMADGFIAGWDAKFTYNSWRPVTAIRAGDTDRNDHTLGDPAWETFLNTPPHPDYVSTHSVLGSAAATVLARFFCTDEVAFTTTSGLPFAGIERSYSSFSQAAQENANSRLWAGVHFPRANRDGLRLGQKLGAYVFRQALPKLKDE